jgi:uncharacterized protein YndB with AHSA1/START domain
MTHPFEIRNEIEVAAEPDAVWEALTTGPGIDGWFLGVGNEVERRLGGRIRLSYGDQGSGESTITAFEPGRRFAHRGDAGPDGTFHAMEYEIEGRGGSTIVRLVHSGFLGDDWEAEYEALGEGDFMYLHLLAQYVRYFAGRQASAITTWEPEADREQAMRAFRTGLGLGDDATQGDRVSVRPEGLPPIEGVIDFTSGSILGVRTDDGLLRFLHAPQGVAYVGHHLYDLATDPSATQQAWRDWLRRHLS